MVSPRYRAAEPAGRRGIKWLITELISASCFFVGLLGVLVTVDIVVGLQALYYWQSNQTEAVESLYQQPAELKKLQEAQRNSLTEYRMVDAGKKNGINSHREGDGIGRSRVIAKKTVKTTPHRENYDDGSTCSN